MGAAWEKPVFRRRDVEKMKRAVKKGDKFIYLDTVKDVEEGVAKRREENVAVIKKFPHIVQVKSLENPHKTMTMPYIDLLMQRMGLIERVKE